MVPCKKAGGAKSAGELSELVHPIRAFDAPHSVVRPRRPVHELLRALLTLEMSKFRPWHANNNFVTFYYCVAALPPHTSHVSQGLIIQRSINKRLTSNGFSPVCVLMWEIKWSLAKYLFLQYEHTNFRSFALLFSSTSKTSD